MWREKTDSSEELGDHRNTRDSDLGLLDGRIKGQSTSRRVGWTYLSLLISVAAGLSLFYLFARSPHLGPCGSSANLSGSPLLTGHEADSAVCSQTAPIAPDSKALSTLEALYQTEEFKQKAYESLGGAVRIP